jgi:hypothetical protein
MLQKSFLCEKGNKSQLDQEIFALLAGAFIAVQESSVLKRG